MFTHVETGQRNDVDHLPSNIYIHTRKTGSLYIYIYMNQLVGKAVVLFLFILNITNGRMLVITWH